MRIDDGTPDRSLRRRRKKKDCERRKVFTLLEINKRDLTMVKNQRESREEGAFHTISLPKNGLSIQTLKTRMPMISRGLSLRCIPLVPF